MNRILLIATVLMTICATAWSQGGPPPGGPGGPGGPGAPSAVRAVTPPPAAVSDMLAGKLGLTTTVAASLKTILTASDAAIQPLQETAGDAVKALQDSLSAATFDPSATTTLAAAAQKAEGDVIAASILVWTQLRTILTADQVAQLQMGPPHGGPPPGSGSNGSSTQSMRR